MVCPHCGRQVDPGSAQCPGCRATLPHGGSFFDAPTAETHDAAPGAVQTARAAAQEPPRTTPAPKPDTGPLVVGTAFGVRYHIIRLLGIGGMGAVYQAWDAELGVAVAIKVIRPEVMSDPALSVDVEQRFKRELLLARQVSHRNVVRIHDLGEIDGIKYITMSYVSGTNLAAALAQAGPRPVSEALRIARSVAAGLAAAHAAGVVHRDLKPANVMLGSDGEAVIMDFGIASSTGDPAAMNHTTRVLPAGLAPFAMSSKTVAGSVIGTLEYMAPEQAKGLPVDQRADIYAFGLILYDMLAGRTRAERAASALAELQQRLTAPPPPLKTVVPGVPSGLESLVARCLETDPAKRFQTSKELAAALDRLDDRGETIRAKRVAALPLAGAVLTAVLAAAAGTWWLTRDTPAPPPHTPVSVVIADFQNATGDPTFDRILEPILRIALEDAGFISAYDRDGITRTLGVRPPDALTEVAARELAVREGLGIVLSGAVTRQGGEYQVAVKAAQAVTGTLLADASERASDRGQVVAATTSLATQIRRALGDETSDAAQRFAMETLSATSLEVVREYAAAMEAMSDSRFADARTRFANAVRLDEGFGLAYAGMAMASRNLGQQQEAEEYIKQGIRHLDRMTERERYRTRGLFYLITGDYQACVKEYGDLLARYSADVTAHNNLALCSTHLRDLPGAVKMMSSAVEILPKRALYRVNLALYAAYASDFRTAEQEANTAQELGSPLGLLPLAFAQAGAGRIGDAADTYRAFSKVGALGASYAASGLADLALYEGRFAEAARTLEQGAAADLEADEPDRAAAKLAALAHVRLLQRERSAAAAAAARALATSQTAKIRFQAARVFVGTGDAAQALELAGGLTSELQALPQALGKIIEGQAALETGDAREAIRLLTESVKVTDTWIGRFDLGRAYLAAGAFTQADSEFDRCLARRGEALSLFLDEEPTFGHFPSTYYYQGRAREGLMSSGYAEPYRTYLAIRGAAGEDPLLPELRKRVER